MHLYARVLTFTPLSGYKAAVPQRDKSSLRMHSVKNDIYVEGGTQCARDMSSLSYSKQKCLILVIKVTDYCLNNRISTGFSCFDPLQLECNSLQLKCLGFFGQGLLQVTPVVLV